MSTRTPAATSALPSWDLTTIFPSLDSPEYAAALDRLSAQVEELESFTAALGAETGADPAALAPHLGRAVEGFNALLEEFEQLNAYLYGLVAADSHDAAARKALSELDLYRARVQKLQVRLRAWLGGLGDRLAAAAALHPAAQAHAFFLNEEAEQARYLMSPQEEELAAELNLSGANLWAKLQRVVTSQITVDFDIDGTVQTLTAPALINLRSHPNEDVRRRAYEAENRIWAGVAEPLAAAINGIKGTTNTLNARRGRTDALHQPLDTARMDRDTLDALLGAMEGSFPLWRRYFRAKAGRLGKEQLAWWDFFAPLGSLQKSYSWDEAQSIVTGSFATFSPHLEGFARTAFERRWVDAVPRDGKTGGAFCMPVLGVRESRILMTFTGDFDGIGTLAHELGHGFHNFCAFRAAKTPLQMNTPMTLAETASIMCETILNDALRSQAATPDEELAILENELQGASQVIVDIYSRFLFEKEVLERRQQAELSVDDLNEIMERAQLATYGDGLDPRFTQKYMWTWKPHYYSAEMPYYNFPYTFGMLFATGLYAVYKQRGPAFVDDYMDLLASTGEAPAAELAARFGIDIRSRAFWDDSIAILAPKVDRFCALA